jgi:hypothetical protein
MQLKMLEAYREELVGGAGETSSSSADRHEHKGVEIEMT